MLYDEIKDYLDRNNIKQTELANHLGISRQLLCNKLHGKCRITADEYIAICDFLRVDHFAFSRENTKT